MERSTIIFYWSLGCRIFLKVTLIMQGASLCLDCVRNSVHGCAAKTESDTYIFVDFALLHGDQPVLVSRQCKQDRGHPPKLHGID